MPAATIVQRVTIGCVLLYLGLLAWVFAAGGYTLARAVALGVLILVLVAAAFLVLWLFPGITERKPPRDPAAERVLKDGSVERGGTLYGITQAPWQRARDVALWGTAVVSITSAETRADAALLAWVVLVSTAAWAWYARKERTYQQQDARRGAEGHRAAR